MPDVVVPLCLAKAGGTVEIIYAALGNFLLSYYCDGQTKIQLADLIRIGVIGHIVKLMRFIQVLQIEQGLCCAAFGHGGFIFGQRYRRQDANDKHHHQKLNQGKTPFVFNPPKRPVFAFFITTFLFAKF